MAWLSRLLGTPGSGASLHDVVVAQARRPRFYESGAAQDTFEGRFDMTVLHAALVMRRLRSLGDDGKSVAQRLFDRLFSGFDHALRERATGDSKVTRKVRELGESFIGQARALDAALDAEDRTDELKEMLSRNGAFRAQITLEQLASYVLEAERRLGATPPADLLAGRVAFPPVEDYLFVQESGTPG